MHLDLQETQLTYNYIKNEMIINSKKTWRTGQKIGLGQMKRVESVIGKKKTKMVELLIHPGPVHVFLDCSNEN